jgi:hypothetical protein
MNTFHMGQAFLREAMFMRKVYKTVAPHILCGSCTIPMY